MQTKHPEANGPNKMKRGVLFLAVLFFWAGPGWAAEESQRSITKETILQWVERYRDAAARVQTRRNGNSGKPRAVTAFPTSWLLRGV